MLSRTSLTVYGCDPDEAAVFRRMAPRFAVSPTVTSAPLSVHNTDLAAGSQCVSVSHKTSVDAPALAGLSRTGVRYLSTRSIGVDHIDLGAADRFGIVVGTVSYSPDSVADYTLMLILMALRHARSIVTSADRHDYRLGPRRGRELRDLTVGVVGTGRIGGAVLDRLRGFGCRTLCHDRMPTSAGHVSLDELVQRSDVVTLHIPLTAETHHLLDRRRITSMKRGAVVVNTARGALVDTAALVGALEAGALGGAALDVVEGEAGIFYEDYRAIGIDNTLLSRLHALPNVVLTPHTAYYTDHTLSDVVEASLASCIRFEQSLQHA